MGAIVWTWVRSWDPNKW